MVIEWNAASTRLRRNSARRKIHRTYGKAHISSTYSGTHSWHAGSLVEIHDVRSTATYTNQVLCCSRTQREYRMDRTPRRKRPIVRASYSSCITEQFTFVYYPEFRSYAYRLITALRCEIVGGNNNLVCAHPDDRLIVTIRARARCY